MLFANRVRFSELSILGMFDRDRSGQIDLNEFQALWTYIHQWKSVFDQFDRDRSGSIDVNELNNGKILFKINFCFISKSQIPEVILKSVTDFQMPFKAAQGIVLVPQGARWQHIWCRVPSLSLLFSSPLENAVVYP